MDQKSGNSRLNGPPPLPSEAKRKAPSSWMDQKQGDAGMGLGADAGSPMIQIMGLSAQMQAIIQKASALNPEQADVWATILNATNQAFGQALAAQAAPQGMAPPPGGPPQGPGMAPPQGMPMPPMGGQPGM